MAGFAVGIKLQLISTRRLSIGCLILMAGSSAYGQATTLGTFPPAVSTKAFSTIAVSGVKAGTAPSQFVLGKNCKSSWSNHTHKFVNSDGTGSQIKFPVLGIVNCTGLAPDGFSVYASTTTVLTDFEADKVSRVGGYRIETRRQIKAGIVIPTLMFLDQKGSYSIISIAPGNTSNDKTEAAALQPWLIVFDERLNQNDRALVLQAWQESTSNLRTMLTIPGLFE